MTRDPEVEAALVDVGSDDSVSRLGAIEVLAQHLSGEAAEALARLLLDPSPDVRSRAAEVLQGTAYAPEVVRAYLERAKQVEDVPPEAKEALRSMVRPQGLDTDSGRQPSEVDAALADLESGDVASRVRAVEALGRSGTAEAAEGLGWALCDESEAVRLAAASAVRGTEHPAAVVNILLERSDDAPEPALSIEEVLEGRDWPQLLRDRVEGDSEVHSTPEGTLRFPRGEVNLVQFPTGQEEVGGSLSRKDFSDLLATLFGSSPEEVLACEGVWAYASWRVGPLGYVLSTSAEDETLEYVHVQAMWEPVESAAMFNEAIRRVAPGSYWAYAGWDVATITSELPRELTRELILEAVKDSWGEILGTTLDNPHTTRAFFERHFPRVASNLEIPAERLEVLRAALLEGDRSVLDISLPDVQALLFEVFLVGIGLLQAATRE